MPDRWINFWGKYYKQILVAAGCACAALFLVFIVVNGKKLKSTFDPDLYANGDERNSNVVNYDSTVFGSQEDSSDGLEMDDKAEEDYNLEDGSENLLENENDENQQSIQIAGGNGDGSNSSGNNNAINAKNDGNGTVINSNDGNSGNDAANGNDGGFGNNTEGGNGSGNGTAPGTDDGNVPGTGDGTHEGNGGSEGNDGSGEGEKPAKPDPDENKYGVDYTAKEEVTSTYPGEETDIQGKITVKKLTVSGSLEQHFYEGEFPRSNEMEKYITVTAAMSDGSVRKDLKFIPFEGKGTGGDYSVDWSGTDQEESEGVGKNVGSDYTATIIYRGASVQLTYDIVHWQVTLKDFEEDFTQYDDSGDEYPAGEYEKVLTPSSSPILSLTDPFADMYVRIGVRTGLNENNGTNYKYVNKTYRNPSDPFDYTQYCLEYFGGWSESRGVDSESIGNQYKMKRPQEGQISAEGVYDVTLYPTWKSYSEGSEFTLVLNGWVGGNWNTSLYGYTGDSTTLVVPEGINIMALSDMRDFADEEALQRYSKIKKIIFPASLNEYTEGGFDWIVDLFPNLEEFEVNADNQNYMDIDGILYTKTGKQLLRVPPGKTVINKWSKTVELVRSSAFQNVDMTEVNLPESVKKLQDYSFLNAGIDTLIVNCRSGLKLGSDVFESELTDEAGQPKLGIRKIVIRSDAIEWTSYSGAGVPLFGDIGNEELAAMGLTIVVPDSENNKIYLEYLKKLQEGMDAFSNNIGSAFSVLRTENKAEDDYSFKEGYLLSRDGKTLISSSTLQKKDSKIPDGVEVIARKAFDGCSRITSLGVTSSVIEIQQEAFSGADNLLTIYMRSRTPAVFEPKIFGETMAEGMKIYVPESSLERYIEVQGAAIERDYGAEAASGLFVPLGSMDDTIFDDGNIYYRNDNGTYMLYKVKNTMTGIFTPMQGTVAFAEGCFTDCTRLNGVVIPDTVTTLKKGIFENCSSLQVIASNGAEAPDTNPEAFAGLNTGQVELLLPNQEGIKEKYEAQNWTGFKAVENPENHYIGEAVGTNNGAIYGVKETGTNLIRAIVNTSEEFSLRGDTVEISHDAFRASSVTGVTNAYSVSTVGASAFEDCHELVGIELSSYFWDEVPEFGAAAFKNCSKLSSLSSVWAGAWTMIPNGMTSLPDECFYGCSSITRLSYPPELESLGEKCFAECTGMIRVEFGTNVTTLGEGCFQNCAALVEVISTDPSNYGSYYSLPYELTEVPDNCFSGCVSFNETWLQTKVRRVGNYAFENCSTLPYMIVPASVTELGAGSLAGCSALTDMEVQGELDVLGAGAFAGATSLTAAKFMAVPKNIQDISDVDAVCSTYFDGCPLESLIMGDIDLLIPKVQPQDAPEVPDVPDVPEVPAAPEVPDVLEDETALKEREMAAEAVETRM